MDTTMIEDADTRAEKIIGRHVTLAMGVGLVPVPVVDVLAVTAIQIDMLERLATLYGADFGRAQGRALVTALSGSALARLGASAIKAVPGLGFLLGGVSMSSLAGATTFAVGQVVKRQLVEGRDFLQLDLAQARDGYHQALHRGTEAVDKMRTKSLEARSAYAALRELRRIHLAKLITDDEYETRRQTILDRL